MSNRDKLSIAFFVFGLSLLVAGVATGSHALIAGGLLTLTVATRYRKRPPFWDYFVSHVVVLVFVFLVFVALAPPSSPLIYAIPLMLSYVLDYIDEQRQKHAALSRAALAPGTTPAELCAAPNGGPAAPVEKMKLTEGPPSVS